MISVIVPVYNVASYLPHCVRSLIGQTLRELEIILVDDGSTDESGAVCDRFALEDTRVRVIHKENGGLSSARNAGLDVIKGDFVLFVDGDDYLAPDAAERLYALALQFSADAPVDFVQFHFVQTPDESWRPAAEQQANPALCTDVREMFERLYRLGGVAASSCTKLFRAALFDDLRFRCGIAHEDEQLMTVLLPRCSRVLYTDLELYGYVTREGSIIHSAFRPRRLDVFPVLDERIEVLDRLGFDDLVRQTRERQFCTAAWLYCLARRGGFRAESAQLKARLRLLSRLRGLRPEGQYRILYHLTRFFGFAPELYYQFRRLCGKS